MALIGLCKHSETKQVEIATNASCNYGFGVPRTIQLGLTSLSYLFTSRLYSPLRTLASFTTDTISSHLFGVHLHLFNLISHKSLSTYSSHLDLALSTLFYILPLFQKIL
jgi:hypothetical protein